MKRVIVILLALVTLTACGTVKPMSDKEITEKGYSTDGLSVLKDGVIVATATSNEWELSNGKIIQEISLTIETLDDERHMKDILRYMHRRFPKAKIEINADGLSFDE